MTAPPAPEPDVKDWTWVLSRPCADCGYDASAPGDLAAVVAAVVAVFAERLAAPDAARRPAPEVWSPVEYACHIRDVCRRFDLRLGLMRTEDDPLFENWDQDVTATQDRYWEQDAATVLAGLREAADRIVAGFAAVPAEDEARPGRRSDGAVFTIDGLRRYFLHDLVHHAWDVAGVRAGSLGA